MLDYLYRTLRKSLNPTVYRSMQCGPLGKAREHDRIEFFSHIISRYKREAGDDFRNKIVLEVGSGNQIYTSLFFLAAGAKKTIAVDPKILATPDLIRSNLDHFHAFSPGSSISEEMLEDRLLTFRYMKDIPARFDSSVDRIFSHVVLEHFVDLPSFFQNAARLMNPNGLSYDIVDLSDHAYHVFDKYKATRWILRKRALFHLRYSDRTFRTILDSRYHMNRLLLPVYLELAEKHGFEATVKEKSKCKRTKIHEDVLSNFKSRNPDDLYITSFEILLRKPS